MSKRLHPADHALQPLPSGNDPALLPQVRGWSWGAFFLPWVWAFKHRLTRLAVAALVVSVIPVVAVFTLAFAIYLGKRGNELAWRRRPFAGLEQFRATQREWRRWGIGVWVTLIALAAIMWPPLHSPLSEHRDCARCHLKRTRQFLRQRHERGHARLAVDTPAASPSANSSRGG
jgi:hypothetical protein